MVIFKDGASSEGTYRPTQKKFYSIQKKLEPFRIQYSKAKTFKSSYRIVLFQEDIKMGTYKVPEQMFEKMQTDLSQYRSLGVPTKKSQMYRNRTNF